MKLRYIITGYVLGNYWGGGKGCYPSVRLQGEDLDKLIDEANEKLEDGSLDSGMGYEKLIGAQLCIETIRTIKQDNREYHNSEFTYRFIGNLSKEEMEFLDKINID